MAYIYQAILKNPSRVEEFPTEKETMEFLSANGGGIYRNLLHRFDCTVAEGELSPDPTTFA